MSLRMYTVCMYACSAAERGTAGLGKDATSTPVSRRGICASGIVTPRNVYKWTAKFSHGKTHVSTGGMVEKVLQIYTNLRIQSLLKEFLEMMFNEWKTQHARKPRTDKRNVSRTTVSILSNTHGRHTTEQKQRKSIIP